MKNYIFIFLFIFTPLLKVCSQNLTEDFSLLMPETKVKSVYSKLTVIDARIDTTNMGIIQKGAFNRKAFLKPLVPLKKQVEDVFKNMIQAKTTSTDELVLNIRDFKFAEITEALSETGYCYFRADLFSKKDAVYQKIDSIDTVYEVNAMDVTKKNIKNGSDKLIDFLASNVKFVKSGPGFTYNDILNIVSLEKRKIPVYNTNVYKDGIYQLYDNFKMMSPAASGFEITRNKKGKITKLERVWGNGSKAEVNPNDIYCVVQEGKIYITSSYGFAPVEFKNDDFYFQGKAKVAANSGNVVLASAFFGIIGGLIASEASAQFEMKIDHVNGTPILLKQLDK